MLIWLGKQLWDDLGVLAKLLLLSVEMSAAVVIRRTAIKLREGVMEVASIREAEVLRDHLDRSITIQQEISAAA
jgi:hypothetical protein